MVNFVVIIFLVVQTCIGTRVLADDLKKGVEKLSLSRKTRYDLERIKVFQDGKIWFCSSEVRDFYLVNADPIPHNLLDRAKTLKTDQHCEDRIDVVDNRTGMPRNQSLCFDSPIVKKTWEQLRSSCLPPAL